MFCAFDLNQRTKLKYFQYMIGAWSSIQQRLLLEKQLQTVNNLNPLQKNNQKR
jgi:hypothetical protein